MKKIGILGSGSWATALAKIATENNEEINWYVRTETNLTHFQNYKNNPRYLSQVDFSGKSIRYFADLNPFIEQTEVIILATPSPYIKAEFEKITANLETKIIFIATKGIIPDDYQLISDYLHDKYQIPYQQMGAIAGPCHAEEIAMERLSYLTFACADHRVADWFQQRMKCKYLITITNDDLLGSELGAVLKNIFAIAAGISHGLGYGDNYLAVLMANSIREMKQMVDLLYPQHRDIKESAYLGDLLVTGYSVFSRNRMFGNMIGKGYTVKAAQMEMNMIAEGYFASACVYGLIENHHIDQAFPIIEAVHHILYQGLKPKKAFQQLSEKLS